MSTKSFITLGIIIGSTIGGYIPILLGADFLSYWSIIGNGAGALVGIFVGYKLSNFING